jgi:hypothetical protein
MNKEIVHKIMGEYANEGRAMARLDEVLSVCGKDEVATSLLEKLLESAERYFQCVVSMERKVRLARFRLEGQDLRDLIQSLDTNRRLAHNTLIDNVAILNRYLFREFGGEIPVGGIFSKDPEAIRDRAVIGDWAGELLYSLYYARKR